MPYNIDGTQWWITHLIASLPQQVWTWKCCSRFREVPRDVRGDREPTAAVLPPRRRRRVPANDLSIECHHHQSRKLHNANIIGRNSVEGRTLQVFSSSDQDLRVSPSSPQPKPPLPYFCAPSKSSRLNVIDKCASELTTQTPSSQTASKNSQNEKISRILYNDDKTYSLGSSTYSTHVVWS